MIGTRPFCSALSCLQAFHNGQDFALVRYEKRLMRCTRPETLVEIRRAGLAFAAFVHHAVHLSHLIADLD